MPKAFREEFNPGGISSAVRWDVRIDRAFPDSFIVDKLFRKVAMYRFFRISGFFLISVFLGSLGGCNPIESTREVHVSSDIVQNQNDYFGDYIDQYFYRETHNKEHGYLTDYLHVIKMDDGRIGFEHYSYNMDHTSYGHSLKAFENILKYKINKSAIFAGVRKTRKSEKDHWEYYPFTFNEPKRDGLYGITYYNTSGKKVKSREELVSVLGTVLSGGKATAYRFQPTSRKAALQGIAAQKEKAATIKQDKAAEKAVAKRTAPPAETGGYSGATYAVASVSGGTIFLDTGRSISEARRKKCPGCRVVAEGQGQCVGYMTFISPFLSNIYTIANSTSAAETQALVICQARSGGDAQHCWGAKAFCAK